MKEYQGCTQYANSSSRRIFMYLGWFLDHIYDLHAKLFTFLLVYLFSLVYFYLDLFPFLVLGVI